MRFRYKLFLFMAVSVTTIVRFSWEWSWIQWPFDQDAPKTRLKALLQRPSPNSTQPSTGPPLTQPSTTYSLTQHIREACSKLDGNSSSTVASRLNEFLVEDRSKVLYCPVPKAATCNWRRVMYVLSGKLPTKNTSDIQQHDIYSKYRNLLPRLLKFNDTQAQLRQRTYFKFMIARDPFERLLSAWRNKFQSNKTESLKFRRNKTPDILRRYRNASLAFPDQLSVDTANVTFEEFLRWVVDQAEDGRRLNEHWELMTRLCQPCAANFDFVGKFERLESGDAEHVLELIGPAAEGVSFPNRSLVYIHSRTADSMEDSYAAIPPDLLRRVYQVYRQDMDMFDYPVPEFLQEVLKEDGEQGIRK